VKILLVLILIAVIVLILMLNVVQGHEVVVENDGLEDEKLRTKVLFLQNELEKAEYEIEKTRRSYRIFFFFFFFFNFDFF